jgi:hypothetical protein
MQAFPPLYEKNVHEETKKIAKKIATSLAKPYSRDDSVQKDLKFDKKKDVNGIVIKNKHRNSCVRARQPCSPLQREVDAVIPKNIEHCASARRSLHAFRVLARARTRFLVNLL